ncbi:MAG: PAS domain S-box protein, partial [Acidobacteria bacterium]|nr:PAS domain S-box protein [Acidobacteriota bacterium]
IILLVLLDGVVVVGALRLRGDHDARAATSSRAAAVAAIESARIEVSREAALATSTLSAEDPSSFVDAYQQSQAASDDALNEARSSLVELNDTGAADAINALSLALGYLRQDVDVALNFPLGRDGATPLEAGQDYVAQIQPRLDQAVVELGQLAAKQQAELAAQRQRTYDSSDVTVALLITASAFALVAGAAGFALIALSVIRPLAMLQTKLSGAVSGDCAAAPVLSGPTEVASLALHFDLLAEQRLKAEEAWRAADQRYRTLFETSLDAVFIHDLDGQLVDANDAALRLLSCTRDELLESSVLDFFDDSQRPVIQAAVNGFVENGVHGALQTARIKRSDGEPVDVEVTSALMRTESGAPLVLRVARDISYRIRAEEVLRGSEDKYRQIFESVQDIFYRTDAQGIITEIGPAVSRWGYTPQELIGTQVLDVYVDPEERQGLLTELMTRGEVTDYEVKLRSADGNINYSSVGSHVVRGPDGEIIGVEGVLRDINERKKAEEALRDQMRRDPLTGVFNHAAIVSELRDLVATGDESASCAVLMNDVDSLKAINDTFGHPVGDGVLVAVAQSLSKDGALVGRYGGDEFIAVLPGAGRSEAEQYKENVLQALSQAGVQDPQSGVGVPMLLSMGIAIYPIEANRIEDLIQLADSGMYAAKRQRREASSGLLASRRKGGDYDAARIVGEIVPYLTTTGNLEEKLRLVARRLSVAAGYDAVSFVLFDNDPEAPPSMITFARGPERLLNKWNNEELKLSRKGHLTGHGTMSQRPQIMRGVDQHPRFTDAQRELLQKAGLKSAMTAPMHWRNDLIGMLAVASELEDAFTPHDAQVLTAVATQVSAIVNLNTLVEELRAASGRLSQAHTETVMLLAAAAEAHDRTTGKHLKNVRAISERLAGELGWSDDDARQLGLAAVLHDIGKIRVTDSVLANTGRLSSDEWELMKHHSIWGEQFLAGRSGFDLAARIARSHHERWNGTGYPDGLAGEGIPDAAAIVSVADSFDAMTSDRPYKPGRSAAAAMHEVVSCSGAQFSPTVVDAMVRLYKERKLPRRGQRPVVEEQAA